MLLLTLMTIGMLKMQFEKWIVKMDGGLNCLTTRRVEVVVEQGGAVVVTAKVALI